ncbi:efflux RND transporter permease subunit [Candidatus Albibeggiatoa sp. nov. BB20]|uniref:efflux RND transporter permease subunit n=1 Tax=Candidatus Albibeggiatoa sp. nov. BB20 TaxID=3162723 RepID=UPI003365728E
MINALIDTAIRSSRTVILLLIFILFWGSIAYINMPKESDPDVAIPIIYISMTHEGISPSDAERLLVRPMEKELRVIEGVKEMTSTASEGFASVMLEFDAGFDSEVALRDVIQKMDIAKAELPQQTDEPVVSEVNVALFPILVVTLSGDVPERTLLTLARQLKDSIESIPEVLKVDIGGEREEVLDIIIEPLRLESYQLSYDEVFQFFSRNNILIAAGALDSGQGRFNIKVPGVFENIQDILDLPIKTEGEHVVMLQDIADIRRTFKDVTTFARVNGKPALSLEISKRIGTNIISTIEKVRYVVGENKKHWKNNVTVGLIQDKSNDVRIILKDLQNNVLSAIILVFIVIVAALGLPTAMLVGIAIPGSFLLGILALANIGVTLNIVVLFSLILASGMLIDGAVIVTEFADRKMSEGASCFDAYSLAAKRMAWPIIGSTSTTLAVFLPLLFWPGVIGEFMKYLPMTVLATLVASLFMALIFMPTLGAHFGVSSSQKVSNHDNAPLDTIRGLTGLYVRMMRVLLRFPILVLLLAIAMLVGVNMVYAKYGKGVEFFPAVEPQTAAVNIRTRGDLSVQERDAVVKKVEQEILALQDEKHEFKSIYTLSGMMGGGSRELPSDAIGVIQLEFADWQQRRPASDILTEVRQRVAHVAGVIIEVRKQEGGPTEGKPIQIQVSSIYPEQLFAATEKLSQGLQQIPDLVDIEDNRPLPGIDWTIKVDRKQASRFGVDVSAVGSTVQLVTNGIFVGEYRPNDADEELDIRIRFPAQYRHLETLDQLRINTPQGVVPLSLFVERIAQQQTGTIKRSDEKRVYTVQTDVAEGILVNDKLIEIRAWLEKQDFPATVSLEFKGEDEEQRDAEAFLSKAFGIALFSIMLILVAQFNSFYQTLLILSAVILSTIGVLIGLLVTQQPFGIVMCGIGVIALAGIVVNNNIVLIDTFNLYYRSGMSSDEAILRTCAQRLRPVMLTTTTTILGLLPMVLSMNIDLVTREITFGAPSTQWWVQLATSIAGGLAFATLLTLVLTPCLLRLGYRRV